VLRARIAEKRSRNRERAQRAFDAHPKGSRLAVGLSRSMAVDLARSSRRSASVSLLAGDLATGAGVRNDRP